MRTIHKYQLEDKETLVRMPRGAQPLHVGLDPLGVLCLWAEVVTSVPTVLTKLTIVGTGHPIPEFAGHYVGTALQGSFVWHIYFKQETR